MYITDGPFMSSRKITKIVPIFKSADKSDKNNYQYYRNYYRLIRIFFSLGKVFETLIYNCMMKLIEEKKLFERMSSAKSKLGRILVMQKMISSAGIKHCNFFMLII